MVKLQSLALVDGDEPDAVDLAALYGLLVQGGIPFFEKTVDAGCVVREVFSELVEECQHIRILLMVPVQVETAVQMCGQIVQGHGE